MKTLLKTLLVFIMFMIVSLIMLASVFQTRWGADTLSRWVSTHCPYNFHISSVSYGFSSPQITLHDLHIGHHNQPSSLSVKEARLTLLPEQWHSPLHFKRIALYGGKWDMSVLTFSDDNDWPLEAETLQISRLQLNAMDEKTGISADKLSGGITPWKPHTANKHDQSSYFQLSADRVAIGEWIFDKFLAKGEISSGKLVLNDLGADFSRGAVTARAVRDANGKWTINKLRINDVRLQTNKSLSAFFSPFYAFPVTQIGNMEIMGVHLQGPDWAVSDLHVSLLDPVRAEQKKERTLTTNATHVVYKTVKLTDPIAMLSFSPKTILIHQFDTRWSNGLVRAAGNWSYEDKQLTVDKLLFTGLEYSLPAGWREFWSHKLPDGLKNVLIKKWEANRNLIMDVSPHFPFQLTSLAGTGRDLLLARDHHWGIWSGTLKINAADATFHGADIRYPSLSLVADKNAININEISAFIEEGLLEGKINIDQNPARYLSVDIQARAVPVNIFERWGLPELPVKGKGNLALKLQAQLATSTPLKATLNGKLLVTSGTSRLLQQVKNGELLPHSSS